MVEAQAQRASKLPTLSMVGLDPTNQTSKAFHLSCSRACKYDLEAWVMLLSLGGRVKPDHGEKKGIARRDVSSIHPANAVIQMMN